MKRIIIILLLLLPGCLLQENVPEITVTVEEPPEELIVSDTVDLTISITNEGDAPARNVILESNVTPLLTFEQEEIPEIKERSVKRVKATLEAVDILKEKREFDIIEVVIKVKYLDPEGNQKTDKTSFKFTLRKPKVTIDKVDAGLLPGKISTTEHEKVPITVYVTNEENRKMENLYIVFCSEYGHVTVHRLDIEEVGNCFEYVITDVLWFNDLIAKGFTMEAELPPGAKEVSFVLQIKLIWRHEDYEIVLDVQELRVEVKAA